MLRNSHRKLRERLDELSAAVGGEVGERERDVVDGVLGFFERAVARHEADEEASLFPRLRGQAELEALCAALAEEHGKQAWLAEELGRALDAGDVATMRRVTDELVASYQHHLAREDDELFPAAERLLDEDARAEMLAEMDRRRGR